MKNSLTNSLRKLYSIVTGKQTTPKEVCLEFSHMPIIRPIARNIENYKRIPSKRKYILEGEFPEEDIETLLADIKNFKK
jgi:hypothetical protein